MQSVIKFNPTPCDISKGEVIDESNSCSSSQYQTNSPQDFDLLKDQFQTIRSSMSLQSNEANSIQKIKLRHTTPDNAKPSLDTDPAFQSGLIPNQRRKRNHTNKDYARNINNFGDSVLVSHLVVSSRSSRKIFDPGINAKQGLKIIWKKMFFCELSGQCFKQNYRFI